MEIFDLGLAWDREFDDEFIQGLNNVALKEGLKPYLLHTYNFYSSLKDVTDNRISFRVFLDRTTDNCPTFSGLADFLKRRGANFINHPDEAKKSQDESQMHSMFINYDIPVPKTVYLIPQEERQILEAKIQYISKPFVLKPADGSSGGGIVLNAESLDDILRLKEQYSDVTYLAKERIYPKNLENKPAWFRVFYCLGKIIPCWRHPVTHAYEILTLKQIYAYKLYDIWSITKKIRKACKLDFFSTEIAMKNDEKLVVVDYVNDQCDMRKKSKFNDGVPDDVVEKIIDSIVSFVKQRIR